MFSFYVQGLRAVRYYHLAQQAYGRSLERIASGLRINRAADDPSGLAISERMRAQIRGLHQATRNAMDAISMLNVADGAAGNIHGILQRLRELAVQAGNDTLSSADREAINSEFTELVKTIDAIAKETNFNTIALIDGSHQDNPLVFQIRANAGQSMLANIGNLSAEALGLMVDGKPLELLSPEDAQEALSIVDQAIDQVSSERAGLGARINRLEHTINNLETTRANLTAAESRIRDADIAAETMALVNAQIRMHAALAMIAQINLNQQMVLKLLLPVTH